MDRHEFAPDSALEGDGFELSVPLHGQAPAGVLNKQPASRGGVAFRDLDVSNEGNQRPAAALPSPASSNPGIVSGATTQF